MARDDGVPDGTRTSAGDTVTLSLSTDSVIRIPVAVDRIGWPFRVGTGVVPQPPGDGPPSRCYRPRDRDELIGPCETAREARLRARPVG